MKVFKTLVSLQRLTVALFLILTCGSASSLCYAESAGTPLETVAAPSSTPNGSSGRDYNYLLGPSDIVHIEALNHPDFNVKAPIGADGVIQLPYIGAFEAANLTVSQLRSKIGDELKSRGIFSNISLQVDVVSYGSHFVTMLGGVNTPGLIPLDRAYHLSEILARAGGVKAGSSDYVILRSSNGAERQLSIREMATGNEASDPIVAPGDKVYVPVDVFYVEGQVKTPGSFPLTLNMTLAMALARGGGLTDLGSDNHITITRHGAEIKPSDLNFKIQPDDVIDVGESWF